MPAMLQEGGYLFQQEASQQGIRGEASAPIAIWSIPERRPEHELNLLSINTLASTAFNSSGKLLTIERVVTRVNLRS